ncbi:MAG: DUF4358 domain-containing protein [Clostridiales bacterium]|nr:DUF4358 domain-containing protein [Clostridiales bacterium]
MKKFGLAYVFAIVVLLGSCSVPSNKIDLVNLGSELTSSSAFAETPQLTDSSIGYMLYSINETDCAESYFWFSSGATAEEIALIKASDEDAASRVFEAVGERVRFQIESFEDYVPEEVPKLEAATMYKKGLYVIYCCADDNEAAKKIIYNN